MDSLSQIADVVIGVDTHVATHSAAAVDTRTGGVLAEVTVEAAPDGYEALVEFADQQPGLRAWAIEGTGGHGAGLARHLARRGELVAELDRPERARRRNGAKSRPAGRHPRRLRSTLADQARHAVGDIDPPVSRCWSSLRWPGEVRRLSADGRHDHERLPASASVFARSCNRARSSRCDRTISAGKPKSTRHATSSMPASTMRRT